MTRPCSVSCVREGFIPGRSRIRAAGRLVVVAGGALLAMLAVLAGSAGSRPGRTGRAAVGVHVGSRILLRSMGIRVVRHGGVRDGAALVVANHVSWLDVPVIAAMTPVVPVAKDEVAGWPVIGALARRVGTVFVHRRTCRDLPDTVARITASLRRGYRVLIFPEGTTTCGGAPHGVHRAGLQGAVDAAAVVVPVSIAYTDRRGRPTNSAAFVGDDDLVASVWRVLRSGPLVAHVRWQPPVPAIQDRAHRARHRARAASRAHGRISRALAA